MENYKVFYSQLIDGGDADDFFEEYYESFDDIQQAFKYIARNTVNYPHSWIFTSLEQCIPIYDKYNAIKIAVEKENKNLNINDEDLKDD